MPEKLTVDLTPNTRERYYANGYLMLAPLSWEVSNGIICHLEYEFNNTDTSIEAKMLFVFEGLGWGQGGYEKKGKYTLHYAECGGDIEITHLPFKELSVNFCVEEAKCAAIELINEWIDKNHLEIYSRYVANKPMRVFKK